MAEKQVKVIQVTLSAGPEGIIQPGAERVVSEKEAKLLVKEGFARYPEKEQPANDDKNPDDNKPDNKNPEDNTPPQE